MEQQNIQFGEVTIKIISNSEQLTVAELIIPENVVAMTHQHIHEEVNYVVSGLFDFMRDGKTFTLGAGESICIPSNLPHNIKNRGAGGVILSVWSPSRTDLIDKLTKK